MTSAPPNGRRKRDGRKRINLALQGGGAHGAVTWGVLDALLEDERLEIAAVSGTSAGAVNAAILASGLCAGGTEGARAALRAFWRDLAIDGHVPESARGVVELMLTPWKLGAAAGQNLMEATRNVLSPYNVNPLDINPLRAVVERHIDFEAIRSQDGPKLHIAATNVKTGRIRIFGRKELRPDVVMASAALPYLFRAVEIDGEPYWDGGFLGNPALFPFFDEKTIDDIVLVQINPIAREQVPETAADILERANEIAFNASLMHEFRVIAFVSRLIDSGALKDPRYRSVRMHRVDADDGLEKLEAASRLNANWAFFGRLFEMGRAAGERFLKRNFDAIGERSTLDLDAALENDPVSPA